jgi:hypothetical protein
MWKNDELAKLFHEIQAEMEKPFPGRELIREKAGRAGKLVEKWSSDAIENVDARSLGALVLKALDERTPPPKWDTRAQLYLSILSVHLAQKDGDRSVNNLEGPCKEMREQLNKVDQSPSSDPKQDRFAAQANKARELLRDWLNPNRKPEGKQD